MRTTELHKLIIQIEIWKGGGCDGDSVATILGWPPGKAADIFRNIGISNLNGDPSTCLTTDQILIAVLWYHVNTLIKKLEGGSHAENQNPSA
jgi:hypothetical protein